MKNLLLFLIVLLFSSCFNKTNVQKKERINEDVKISNDLDNYVINEIIQPLLDSLNNPIKLNLKNSEFKISYINYLDTLIEPNLGSKKLYQLFGIKFDTIDLNNFKSKLSIKLLKDKESHELKPLSSRSDVKKLISNKKYILLIFTKIIYNTDKSIGFFNVDLSCEVNSGSHYDVLVIKENEKWNIKKMSVSHIVY